MLVMIQSRKISGITTIGIVTAIISLALCIMILSTSYSSSGIAEEMKVIYSYELKNTSNVFISNDEMNIVAKPTINENTISYGINFKQIGDYSQFTFEVENTGNVLIKVKDIHIAYPPELQQYVTVKVEGLNANDIIEPGSTYSNIKVITKYENGYYNAEYLQSILLDNITIKVDFYE